MQQCLQKQGATDEQRCYTKERAKYHTRAKNFLLALKWKMYGLGKEECSDMDGLSDITSVSRMSLSRRNDITRHIEAAVAKRERKKDEATVTTEENLLRLKRKKKEVELEEEMEREKLKLQQMRIDLEEEKEISNLMSQLNLNENEEMKDFPPSLSEAPNLTTYGEDVYTTRLNASAPSYLPTTCTGAIPKVTSFSYPYYTHTPSIKLPPPKESKAPISSNYSYTPLNYASSLNTTGLDPASRHLALDQLRRVPATPYSGEPSTFKAWWQSLKHRIDKLAPTPLDILDILEAHTKGTPQELIILHKNAYVSDASKAVQVIITKLHKRFGDDQKVSYTIREQLKKFSPIRGGESTEVGLKLRKLSDLCLLISAQISDTPDLETLNYASGLDVVRSKLPDFLNNRWRSEKARFMQRYSRHPPFSEFCHWLEEQSDILCSDLTFTPDVGRAADYKLRSSVRPTTVMHTESSSSGLTVETNSNNNDYLPQSSKISKPPLYRCALHSSNTHELKNCSKFLSLDVNTRRLLITSFRLCFRCLGPHYSKSCEEKIQCSICHKGNHLDILHVDRERTATPPDNQASNISVGFFENCNKRSIDAKSLATSFEHFGRSCGKTVLVDVFLGNKSVRTYCILDEQSNQSFATPDIFNKLCINSPPHNYTLTTLSDSTSNRVGRLGLNIKVKGVNENKTYDLPPLFENDCIPDSKEEIATRSLVSNQHNISHLADKFLDLDPNAHVGLLLGRDSGNVLFSEILNDKAPFVHHTALGFAVVGSICLTDKKAYSTRCKTLRTRVSHDHFSAKLALPKIPDCIFTLYNDDEMLDLSVEDKKFISIADNNVIKNDAGNLQIPLPFKDRNVSFPDNQESVYGRQRTTLSRLSKDPTKLNDILNFMSNLIQSNHVEQIKAEDISCERKWFLPIFPVIHPKKLKLRLVFDSAACFSGVSLSS